MLDWVYHHHVTQRLFRVERDHFLIGKNETIPQVMLIADVNIVEEMWNNL